MLLFAASRSRRLTGEGGSVLPNDVVFGHVTGIVREVEGLPFTVEWGGVLPRFADV